MSAVENYTYFPSSSACSSGELFAQSSASDSFERDSSLMGLSRYHSSYQYWNQYNQHYLPQENLNPYSVTSLQHAWSPTSPQDRDGTHNMLGYSYDTAVGLASGAQTLHSGYQASSALRSGTTIRYDVMPTGETGKVRVVKRRNTANKKERRRTVSINSAFGALRGCIPNVPSDTKLSKIKTLRLATSYIAYLMDILKTDDPTLTKGGFKAELTRKTEGKEERRKREIEVSPQTPENLFPLPLALVILISFVMENFFF